MSGQSQLIKMANDIGAYFRSEPVRKDAVAGIANHIAKYWTPRMREKLSTYLFQHSNSELDELPREAFESLSVGPVARKPEEPPGGDAG
jgi:formate dehydrogenase subunit delta